MQFRYVKQLLNTAVASTLYYNGLLTLIIRRKLKSHAVVMTYHRVIQLLKTAAALALYYSGMLKLIAKRKLKARAVVLTYHRVISENRQAYCHSSPGIVVRDDTFRTHLTFLKRFFRILSLAEFIDYVENKKSFPDQSCLITFDDGWLDNYDIAFPILYEFKVPATIFLPVNYIAGNLMFWQEELSLRLTQLSLSSRPADRQYLRQVLQSEQTPDSEQLAACMQKLKGLDYARIAEILEQMRYHQRNTDLPEHDNRYVNWQQVEEMHTQGIAFGSHCLTHRILTHMPEHERREEIEQSKFLLESKLNCDMDAIAYPNGDFNDAVVSLTRKAGYKLGFTTTRGYVSKNTPAYAIPRIHLHDHISSGEATLLCTVLGIF